MSLDAAKQRAAIALVLDTVTKRLRSEAQSGVNAVAKKYGLPLAAVVLMLQEALGDPAQ